MKANFFGAKKWDYTTEQGKNYKGYTLFLCEVHEDGDDYYVTPIRVRCVDSDGVVKMKNLSCSETVMQQCTDKPFKDLFGHIAEFDVKLGTNKVTSLHIK